MEMQLALVLLLLLLVLAPGFLMVAGLGLLMFVPAYLMVSSMLTVALAPQQILAVATDRRTRRRHACEHATVNVLEERFGPLPGVGGVATDRGFYIWGAEGFHPGTLLDAAQQALARMQRGERRLALHPRCGTSLMMARLVFAAAFLLGLFATGYFMLEGVLLALLVSWVFGAPLGLLVQRYLTTSTDVGGLALGRIYWTERPSVHALAPFTISRGAYFFEIR